MQQHQPAVADQLAADATLVVQHLAATSRAKQTSG